MFYIFYFHGRLPEKKIRGNGCSQDGNKNADKIFVEFYCCWDGDWDEPIDHRRKLNSRDIKLDVNYFELVERELILFEKQR